MARFREVFGAAREKYGTTQGAEEDGDKEGRGTGGRHRGDGIQITDHSLSAAADVVWCGADCELQGHWSESGRGRQGLWRLVEIENRKGRGTRGVQLGGRTGDKDARVGARQVLDSDRYWIATVWRQPLFVTRLLVSLPVILTAGRRAPTVVRAECVVGTFVLAQGRLVGPVLGGRHVRGVLGGEHGSVLLRVWKGRRREC